MCNKAKASSAKASADPSLVTPVPAPGKILSHNSSTVPPVTVKDYVFVKKGNKYLSRYSKKQACASGVDSGHATVRSGHWYLTKTNRFVVCNL